MAKVTRKQIAQAFRDAKPYLWDGVNKRAMALLPPNEFICLAIHDSPNEYLVRIAAQKIVLDRLAPFGEFRYWLKHQPSVKWSDLTPHRVQQHRHAWLDMLIKEFSK